MEILETRSQEPASNQPKKWGNRRMDLSEGQELLECLAEHNIVVLRRESGTRPGYNEKVKFAEPFTATKGKCKHE